MKTDTHETDLYILPESEQERAAICSFLVKQKWNYTLERSDVKGQEWYGKTYIEVPFGDVLRTNVEALQVDPAPLTAYRVTYANGYQAEISMAAGVSIKDAEDYFVGRRFDVGVHPAENMQKAVNVELIY